MTDEHAADAFLTTNQPADDVRNGRYHLPDPETGEVRSWTRASNLGVVLADRFGLERWARRRLLVGLGERPDLLTLLAAMVDYDPAKLDEVADTALQVAGSTEAANLGTAIHEAQRRVDAGLEVPDELRRYADGYRSALERHGLTVVTRERRVINRPLGVAGRLDALLLEPGGALVIADTKSTAHLQLAAPEVAVQLACYATADWVETDGWKRMPDQVRTDYAVAIHVDRETGATSLYRVDLRIGAYGANLATQIREYRNLGRLVLLPYVAHVPTGAPVEPTQPVRVDAPIERAPSEEIKPPSIPMVGETRMVQDGDHTEIQQWDGARWSAHPAPVPPTATQSVHPWGTGANQAPMVTENVVRPTGDVERVVFKSVAELTRMTKAQVQTYARTVDPDGVGRDVAHHKAKLIEALERRGKVAEPGRPVVADAPEGSVQAPSIPPASTPEGPDLHAVGMRLIESATSIAELRAAHEYVVRRGGDRAWTAVLADAAKQKAEQVDGPAYERTREITERLMTCNTQEDLANLWNEVTTGGSRPEAWTAEVDAAARERLRQIEAARPPAPSNPFGATS